METPSDRRYLPSHEWHRLLDDGTVEVGISAFAVDELTDITYVESSAAAGDRVEAGSPFGEIESVKATSELYCGIGGEVTEVNAAVIDRPETINDDCYGDGWILRLQPDDAADLDKLQDAGSYGPVGAFRFAG